MPIVIGIGGVLIVLALFFGMKSCSSEKTDETKQEVQHLQQEMRNR